MGKQVCAWDNQGEGVHTVDDSDSVRRFRPPFIHNTQTQKESSAHYVYTKHRILVFTEFHQSMALHNDLQNASQYEVQVQLVSNKRYKRTSWAGVNLDSPLSVSEFVLGSASISMGCSVVISCSNTGDGGRSMRCAGLNGRSLSIHRRRRSTAAREYSSSLGWLSIFLVVDRGNADTATREIHSRKKTSTISRRPTILSHDRPVPRTV